MSNLSRRTLVTSAAALPALAVPALALPAPAAVPILDTAPPELLALGEQLKPLLAEICRLQPTLHKLWQEAHDTGGPYPLKSLAEIHDKHARFDAMSKKNGYNKLRRQSGSLDSKARRIAKRILKIEPTDKIGCGIQAAAVLALSLDEQSENEAGDLLRRMAANAGFSIRAKWS